MKKEKLRDIRAGFTSENYEKICKMAEAKGLKPSALLSLAIMEYVSKESE